MDKKLFDKLMWIGITGMILAGAIFIAVYFFETEKDNELLAAAFFCSILAGIFNIVRDLYKK